jgi:hypothetical protein
MRSVRRTWSMAVKAQLICWLAELGVVVSAVDIVTRGTSDSVAIHYALHEIISLHAVLVRCAIRKMQEVGLTKGDVFELPVVLKAQADVVTDRPVVSSPVDEASTRSPLGVTLNARVV